MKKTLLLFAGLAVLGLTGETRAAEYVCPPCDMECDTKVFAAPGHCPDCGATLVARAAGGASGGAGSGASSPASASAPSAAAPSQAAAPTRPAAPATPPHTAAILLFPGVQIIDYTGPYEVFGQGRFRVHTVARTREPITTAMGMTVVPEHTFETCPAPEVLVVPGGSIESADQDTATIDWIRRTSASAKYTMSVCNGAFLLARAGLLDGRTATTFHRMIGDLGRDYPKVRVVSDQRFVDNGTIITTAGLSSGIDGSLHMLEKILGPVRAKEIALNMEYDWRPLAGYARAALADMKLPAIDPQGIREHRVVETEGDRDRWTKSWQVVTDLSAAELAERIEREIAARSSWKRSGGQAPAESRWTFADDQGQPWTGTVTLRPEAAAGRFRVTIAVARRG